MDEYKEQENKEAASVLEEQVTADREDAVENNTASEGSTEKINNKRSRNAFFLGLAVFLGICLVGLGVYAKNGVKQMSDSSFVVNTAKVLGLPAAKVNGSKVAYTDFIRDVGFIETFYEQQAIPGGSYSADEVAQQAMARLIANKVIEQQAVVFGIELTEEQVNEEVQRRLAVVPDQDQVLAELDRLFGWTLEEYVDNVIYYQILEERLAEAIRTSVDEDDTDVTEERKVRHIVFLVEEGDDPDTVKAEAQAVLDRIKAGEDFATLAQEFGQDGTAASGGDLGFFPRGVMDPAFEQASFSLPVGQLSEELVESQFGYHVLEVTDERFQRNYQGYMDAVIRDANIKMYVDVENPFADPALAPGQPSAAGLPVQN